MVEVEEIMMTIDLYNPNVCSPIMIQQKPLPAHARD